MNDSEFWEPWKPTLGQRVRVRFGPECPLHDHAMRDAMQGREVTVFARIIPGTMTAVSKNGPVVLRYFDPEAAERLIASGHIYGVEFDVPVGRRSDGKPILATELAALEMEPVDE